jgi:hypothetical protein
LSKDKEALKNSMLDVIRKKPKIVGNQETAQQNSMMPKESGANMGNSNGNNTGMAAINAGGTG